MRKFRTIVSYIFKNFQKRHRLEITDLKNERILLQLFISPARIVTLLTTLLVVMLTSTTLLIGYTPLLGMLPGHFGLKTRTLLLNKMSKLDSLETELNTWNVYRENMVRAIDRRPPITLIDTLSKDSTLNNEQIISRSAADSLLRDSLLSPDNIFAAQTNSDSISSRSMLEFFIPVEGAVSREYDLLNGFNGIEFRILTEKPVLSVMDGRVMLNTWNPSEGQIVQIQHSNGLTTTYKGMTSSLVDVGDRVEGGEAIGYVGEQSDDSGDSNNKTTYPLIIEFWQDGNSIDPRNFLIF